MRRFALLAALVAVPALAQELPGHADLVRTAGADAAARPDPAVDRRAILLLAEHVREVDAEIQRASRYAVDVVQDAEAIAAAVAAEKKAAEEARKRANARQIRNGAMALLGASEDDIALANSLDDLQDALRRHKDAQARADLSRRVYVPGVVAVLAPETSTGDLNSLRAIDNFGVALREGRRARQLGNRLEVAKGDVAAAREEARRIREHIEALQADRTRSLELLDGYSERYLGAVNELVGSLPGFTELFGTVRDIAFDLKAEVDGDQPLIRILTFRMEVGSCRGQEGETQDIDVDIDLLGEFLADDFRTLLAQRGRRVESAGAAIQRHAAGVVTARQEREAVQADLARVRREFEATSRLKVFTRNRLSGEIERLERRSRELGQQGGTATQSKASAEREKAEAEFLYCRANAARQRLQALEERAGAEAVGEAYQALRSML
jgi:hypothetical protein